MSGQDYTSGGHRQGHGDWGHGAGDQRGPGDQARNQGLEWYVNGQRVDGPPASGRRQAPAVPADTVTRTITQEGPVNRENPGEWWRNTSYTSTSGASLHIYESGPAMRNPTTRTITLRDSDGHELPDAAAERVRSQLEGNWPSMPWQDRESQRFDKGSPLARAHQEQSHSGSRTSGDRGRRD